MAREGLTPAEDAELRRLHYLRRFGTISDSVSERLTSLRGRDRRLDIREPEDDTVAQTAKSAGLAATPRERAAAR